MHADTTYSIGELAQAAGVTTRTIRYYVAQGLLPPPYGGGRVACYGEGHLHRLELIKLLKQEYLPLNEIKALLDGLNDDAVADLLEEKSQPPQAAPETAKEYLQALLDPPSKSSPLLRQVAAEKAGRPSEPPLPFRPHAAQPKGGPLARRSLVSAGTARLEEETARAHEAATVWHRYPLHPDVELHVRQPPTDPMLSSRLHLLIADVRRVFSKRNS